MVLFHLKNTQKWIFFLGTSTILHSGCNNLQSHHQSTSVEAMRWAWGLGLRKCAVSLNLLSHLGLQGLVVPSELGWLLGCLGYWSQQGKAERETWIHRVPPLPEPTMVWVHGILQGDTWGPCRPQTMSGAWVPGNPQKSERASWVSMFQSSAHYFSSQGAGISFPAGCLGLGEVWRHLCESIFSTILRVLFLCFTQILQSPVILGSCENIFLHRE